MLPPPPHPRPTEPLPGCVYTCSVGCRQRCFYHQAGVQAPQPCFSYNELHLLLQGAPGGA